MTGLDTQRDHIIEIATIVTDARLRVVAEGPVIAIHQPDAVLDAHGRVEPHDAWRLRPAASGCATAALPRPGRGGADAGVPGAVHAVAGASPMCGNSICQDRRFLAREMPALEKFFHYRNLDVSTVKELARRWAPDVLAGVQKASTHLALDDIRESIGELEHYRRTLFRVG